MRKIVFGRVVWLKPEEGGRKSIPDCQRYTPLSGWAEDKGKPGKWDVVLEFDRSPAVQGSPSEVKISFTSELAPNERLKPGIKFSIYEGNRLVGHVEILREGV